MKTPPLPPPNPEAGENPPGATSDRGKFGKMVRAYRKELGLTLETVSEATGLHPTTLSLIECGKRDPPELTDVYALARVLEIASSASTYERFVTLATAERDQSKRRGKRKTLPSRNGAPRRLATVLPPPRRRPGRVPADQPANPLAGPETRDVVLARLLRDLLDLDLAEKIDYVRVSTKAGQEYVIRTDPPEGDI
ncbi:MAG: helix-turn-helix transcriptional regulator [Bryobacterales bacterium]|nr:helix-turn-helix transcriptional regulator [Bryobacterales bacterium]